MSTCDPLRYLMVFICLAAFSLPAVSQAQASGDLAQPVEVILITAERASVGELNSPYSADLIGPQDINEQQYRSTTEAMRNIAGVMVQKTAYGQGSPYLRGFTGYRTLFMIDGIRLNNATFRDGPNQYWGTVDRFSVERFEVLKGNGATLYGSDAIGGTVQAFTTTPVFGEAPRFDYLYRGGSGEHSQILRLSAQADLSAKSVFSAGFSAKQLGDLRGGKNTGKQANSGYDEYDFDAKWLWQLADNWQLNSALFSSRQLDVPRTHKTIFGKSFAGTTVGNELRRDTDLSRKLAYIKLLGDDLDGHIEQARFTLSYQQQQEKRHRLRSGNRADQQGTDVNTLGLQAQFIATLNDTRLVYGFDSYFDHVDSFSSGSSIQGPVADDAGYQWHGAYIQAKLPLPRQLSMDIGIRANYMRLDADSVQDPLSGEKFALEDDWFALVGNIRVNYALPGGRQSLFAGLSQGFRAPNLSDMTRFDSARSNEFEIPASGLKPERYLTFEFGSKIRRETLSVDAAVYYTFIDAQIQRVPTGGQNDDGEQPISKANVGDGYVTGVEFALQQQFDRRWSARIQAAWLTGKADTFTTADKVLVREYISRLMPLSARLSLKYQIPDKTWWLGAQWLGAVRADRLSTRDRNDTQRIPPDGTPGYATLSVNGGYFLTPQLQLNWALENLFDKDYRIHGSGQNEAGINVLLTLHGWF